MTESSFLTEFLIVIIAAAVVATLLERLRFSSILGFLAAGVVIGPHGFALVHSLESIHQMAEIGVILLMLTIGLEFSFKRLKGLGKIAFFGGSLQVLISMGAGYAFAMVLGWTPFQGLLLGSVVALSSTALVFKHLIDRGEIDTQYGRVAVSILIFQDLAIIPLMILTKGMGRPVVDVIPFLLGVFLKAGFLVAAIVIISKYFLRHFLRQMALVQDRETLFLASVAICLGIAWVGGQIGLSLAIGAFFAGVMFANTDYGPQLSGEISSFRHVFVSIFFVSIGLLFDVGFALQNAGLLFSVVGLVLFVNFIIITIILLAFGFSLRIALAAGIILSQIGEFSFVLLETAKQAGGITPDLYQLLLSVAFITMVMTPFLFRLVHPVLRWSEKLPFVSTKLKDEEVQTDSKYSGHIILCGYGPTGKDLAQTFREENLSFVILEMNPGRIREAHAAGLRVIYGDAANAEVMRHAGIVNAKAVVVSFGDHVGMAQIIRVVEELNSDLLLVVRTRFEREVPRLYELGADIVVMEELEANHELNRAILDHFKVPEERIKKHLDRIRARKELLIEQSILKLAANKKL